ncbi:MAG: hypothetical protein NTX66_03540 [Candidatus Falkowbacteria bacterium]|nr:hypothetical protein [Candidatus Falkowbacteria bacterium]
MKRMILMTAMLAFAAVLFAQNQTSPGAATDQIFLQLMAKKAELTNALLQKTTTLMTCRENLIIANVPNGNPSQIISKNMLSNSEATRLLYATDSLLGYYIQCNIENIDTYIMCFDSRVFIALNRNLDVATKASLAENKQNFTNIRNTTNMVLAKIKSEQSNLR